MYKNWILCAHMKSFKKCNNKISQTLPAAEVSFLVDQLVVNWGDL